MHRFYELLTSTEPVSADFVVKLVVDTIVWITLAVVFLRISIPVIISHLRILFGCNDEGKDVTMQPEKPQNSL